MIDYRIILQILHSHLLECSGALRTRANKAHAIKDWVSDDKLIIFPAKDYHYQERVDELNAVQYLQRTRILYTMLLRSN
ncbi:MAG TPA: hypothetical protein VK666_21590 [Chryseolinea sp.]|nr:hypothetical protein [Chryseolinea sp.]